MSNLESFVPLGDIADIRQGRYLAPHEMTQTRDAHNRVPVHGANGIIGWTTEPMYEHSVALVTCRGSNSGMVLWAKGPLWVSNNAMAILPKNQKYRFAYYALLNNPPYDVVSGSAQPQITRTALAPRLVSWPGDEVQESIVGALEAVDNKIELNRRMNETLEAMAHAIFRDWFVDFGPVLRKLTGERDPVAIMGKLILDKDRAKAIAELFPETMDDANVLPRGWSFQGFGQLLADSVGGDWGKEAADSVHTQRVAIIRGTDMPDILAGGRDRVPERYVAPHKMAKRQLSDLDVVIEVSGGSPTQPTGRSILVTQSVLDRFDCPVVCASFCRRFRFKTSLFAILGSQHLTDLYASGGTWRWQNQSTGIANFQTSTFLKDEQVVMPTTAILEEFSRLIEPLIRRATANENLILAKTRDYLLPRLMSGKVRVADVAEEAP